MNPTNKPYPLPDPRIRPDSFLTLMYKTMKRIDYDDRDWDRLYFGRCNKSMMQLLKTFEGDVLAAARCLTELKDRFEGDGLNWTIETIVQYSFEWRADHQRKTDRDCMTKLMEGYKGMTETKGLVRLNPEEVLKRMLELPPPPDEKPKEISQG